MSGQQPIDIQLPFPAGIAHLIKCVIIIVIIIYLFVCLFIYIPIVIVQMPRLLQSEHIRSRLLLHPSVSEQLNQFTNLSIPVYKVQVAHTHLHEMVLIIAHQHSIDLQLNQSQLYYILTLNYILLRLLVCLSFSKYLLSSSSDIQFHILIKIEHLFYILFAILLMLFYQIAIKILNLITCHKTLQKTTTP